MSRPLCEQNKLVLGLPGNYWIRYAYQMQVQYIHDGDKGLIVALNLLYPNIPHQRCHFSQTSQPLARFVATLQRDWHETVAFFRVLKHFPDWQRTTLRTTSLLERLNRNLRRLFRPKGAFHSLTTCSYTLRYTIS